VTARRHAAWFSELAAAASRRQDNGHGAEARHHVARAEADLYAALEFLTAEGDHAAALRLATDLGPLACSWVERTWSSASTYAGLPALPTWIRVSAPMPRCGWPSWVPIPWPDQTRSS
jgi:hypothetical protein